jgi:phosphomannomutase
MVQQAYVAGLVSTGCDVVELGVVSTPGTAMMVRRLEAAGGTVITASHNPIEWNGIKFLTPDGLAPPPPQAEALYARWRERAFTRVEVHQLGTQTQDNSTHDQHVNAVLDVVNTQAIAAKRFKVVLDSVNGAGGTGGRRLLEALGCEIVHINAEPTGRFAHRPEPLAENLTQLCDAVREHRAVVGFAQDPDADRLALVDEKGRYIGEEYTLALVAKQMFAVKPGPAAANLSTSRMIDDLAAAAGCVVYRSPVGEANVVEAMRAHGCVVGGEGNGGVIDPRVVPVRDSFSAMALVLELLARTDRTLSGVVDEIPRYAMVKEKFEVDRARIDRVLAAVRDTFAGERIDDADGIRIDFDAGWVHVRPSNTEPIIRIIGEGRDADAAMALIGRIRAVTDPLLA